MNKSAKVVHELSVQSIDKALSYNTKALDAWVKRAFSPISDSVESKIDSVTTKEFDSTSSARPQCQ